jgi:hypothetical protein
VTAFLVELYVAPSDAGGSPARRVSEVVAEPSDEREEQSR